MPAMGLLAAASKYMFSTMYRVGILVLPSVVAIVAIVHDPAFIRQTLADSGIYESVRTEVLAKSIQATNDPNGKQLLSDPNTQDIILKSFTPDLLQKTSEQLVTDTYRWLDGSASSIQSRLDLTPARDQFLQGVSAYAQQRLTSLPQCTLQQMRTLDVSAQSVLNIPCRPIGIDVAQLSTEYARQVQDSTSFLQDPIVTIDTGKARSANSGQEAVQVSKDLPLVYKLLPNLMWAVGIGSVLAGTLYLALSTDKYRAQKILARWLAGTGVLVLIGVGIGELFIRRYVEHGQSGASTQAFNDSLIKIIRALSGQYHHRLLLIAGVYLGIGVVWWAVVRRMHQPVVKPAK